MNKLSIQFLLLTLCLLTFACKKNKDKDKVNADIAASIAGTYNVNYYKEDGELAITLPQNGASATVQLSKATETTIDVLITSRIDGQVESENYKSITVSRQNDGTVVLSLNGRQVGTVKDKKLEITGSDFTIRASK